MKTKEKTSSIVIKMIIAVIVAVYVLFPFFLVVINSCKPTDQITANPIGFGGVSFSQLISNLKDVINNTHFLFHHNIQTSPCRMNYFVPAPNTFPFASPHKNSIIILTLNS